VKRFVSLQFLNPRQSVGLLERGSARRKAATYTGQHKQRINVDIHEASGIRTHDPCVRAREDISCLRWRGHCDRLLHLQYITWEYVGNSCQQRGTK
jgi:hypothetical protein